jgi:hypothetical protein
MKTIIELSELDLKEAIAIFIQQRKGYIVDPNNGVRLEVEPVHDDYSDRQCGHSVTAKAVVKEGEPSDAG